SCPPPPCPSLSLCSPPAHPPDLPSFPTRRSSDLQACRAWASRILADPDASEVARANALKVSTRLRTPAQTDLRGALLRGEDLSYRELAGVDLTGADLTDAVLVGANLTGAVLRDATLAGARLDEARLPGADLRGANLTRARL